MGMRTRALGAVWINRKRRIVSDNPERPPGRGWTVHYSTDPSRTRRETRASFRRQRRRPSTNQRRSILPSARSGELSRFDT